MPFFKASGKLVYYAHVPKCGGTAVAQYLRKRFGPLGLYDEQYHVKRSSGTNWSLTSPQHIDSETLDSIIPLSMFDERFAVVRHPISRIVSTYYFQKEVERNISEDMNFSEWLAEIEEDTTTLKYDNHVLPMDDIVPRNSKIFHLERGFDPLVDWLNDLSESKNGPDRVNQKNVRSTRNHGATAKVDPTPTDIDVILRVYKNDFERFGYHVDSKYPIGFEVSGKEGPYQASSANRSGAYSRAKEIFSNITSRRR